MSKYNALTVEIYEPDSITRLQDENGELADVIVERISTVYPGGRYGDGLLSIQRDPLRPWSVLRPKPYRVLIKNGAYPVYEGEIVGHVGSFGRSPAVQIPLIGAWGYVGMRRELRRNYCDMRLTDEAWIWDTTAAGAELAWPDRNGRLRITAKGEPWGSGTQAWYKYASPYAMPTGEKIKRVTFDYNLTTVNGEDWTMELYDITNSTSLWSVSRTTDGTTSGSAAVSLATTSADIRLRLESDAAQTAASDASGVYSFAQATNLKVFATTNNSGNYADTAPEIMQDVVSQFSTRINATTLYIGANAYDLTPFITNGRERLASLIARVAGIGDSSSNLYAAGFRPSTDAVSQDGKPCLFYEQLPALSDYEYKVFVRGNHENLQTPITVTRDMGDIWNDVAVEYTNVQNQQRVVTSAMDSSLTDSTSVARWGTRTATLNAGQVSSAQAIQYGANFLAAKKSSKLVIDGGFSVTNYIIGKNGEIVPASQIRAGQRVRLMDYANYAPEGDNPTQMTFLITSTNYSDRDETCQIMTGYPDPLSILAANYEFERNNLENL